MYFSIKFFLEKVKRKIPRYKIGRIENNIEY